MEKERVEPLNRTNVGSLPTSLAMALFAIIAVLIGIDIAVDYRSGTMPSHVLAEGFVMALAVVGLVLMWRRFNLVQRQAKQLSVDLEAAQWQAVRFREEAQDALRGLGEAIDRQFTRWSLTPAEREVGLLLLKGLTHKEIATIRSTTETTVRQQALAVYRKSGLRSRTELSAFFLEDLLLPVAQR
ncbi:MAG TPA: helix-turn-helix transcriptional regulator [Clostridia bacterium]|nr:helix-turn-helix transcriptional regulator [Clostridia bacterium]